MTQWMLLINTCSVTHSGSNVLEESNSAGCMEIMRFNMMGGEVVNYRDIAEKQSR